MDKVIRRVAGSAVKSLLRTRSGQALFKRLRRSASLSEDIVPYDVHSFDRLTWVLKETHFGARIWCSLDERAISRPILLNMYELAETRFIEASVRPGSLVVDAGANIGYHALHFARLTGPTGHIEAFEPLPYLADALQASVDENGFGERVSVHRVGLDERAGISDMLHAPRTENFGGAHFAPIGNSMPEAHAHERVRTVLLDEIVGNRKCHFIKIDVEGAEPRVMRGAKLTLRNGPLILSELHDKQLRSVSQSSATDFIAQMNAVHYRCNMLRVDGKLGELIERSDDQAPLNVVFSRTQ